MSVTLTTYSLHLKKDNLGGVTLFKTMNLDIRLSRFIVLSEVKSLSRLFFFLTDGVCGYRRRVVSAAVVVEKIREGY